MATIRYVLLVSGFLCNSVLGQTPTPSPAPGSGFATLPPPATDILSAPPPATDVLSAPPPPATSSSTSPPPATDILSASPSSAASSYCGDTYCGDSTCGGVSCGATILGQSWNVLAEWGTVNRFGQGLIAASHAGFLSKGWFLASDGSEATHFDHAAYGIDAQVTQWHASGTPKAAYEHYIPAGTTQVAVAFAGSNTGGAGFACTASIYEHSGTEVYSQTRQGEGFGSDSSSCSCIPCGTSTPYNYGSGACGTAYDTCSATEGSGGGCYTDCAANCDCATLTCAVATPFPAPDVVTVDTTAGPARILFEELGGTSVCWTAYVLITGTFSDHFVGTFDQSTLQLTVTVSNRQAISPTDWIAIYPEACGSAWVDGDTLSVDNCGASIAWSYLPSTDPAALDFDLSGLNLNGNYAALYFCCDTYNRISSDTSTPSQQWVHTAPGCVSGHNIIKYTGKTVSECEALCVGYGAECVGFEFGVDYGGSDGNYVPGDCQLSSSADVVECASFNLDFYARIDVAPAVVFNVPAPTLPMVASYVSVGDDSYPSEVSWSLSCDDGTYISGGASYYSTHEVAAGSDCELAVVDSFGDGWQGASWEAPEWTDDTYSAYGSGSTYYFTIPIMSPPLPPSPPPLPPSPPPPPGGPLVEVCIDCVSSCDYLFDGECDDGGPDSDYDDCSLGHDCSDCGPRIRTELTADECLFPPPSPPEQPPYLCDNSCFYGYDGFCDDGRPDPTCDSDNVASFSTAGAVSTWWSNGCPVLETWEGECNDKGPGDLARDIDCALGSDCADCGVRIYCLVGETPAEGCPQVCHDLALSNPPVGACLQQMWNDGRCDPECNNLACGHNECTGQQIIDKCIPEQDLSGVGYSSAPPSDNLPPNSLVPMNVQLDLSPARLEIREDINEMVLTQEVAFLLQWQDRRLMTSPCRQVLPDLLSLTREEANSDLQRNVKTGYRVRYWVPKLEIIEPAMVPGYYAWVEEAAFALENEGEWVDGLAPNYTEVASAQGSGGGHGGGIGERRRALHQKRRARANQIALDRLAAASPDGVASSRTSLRKARHRARMKSVKRGQADFPAAERRRLNEVDDTVPTVACASCPVYAGEIEFETLQGFKYYNFPFDRHTINATYSIEGAHIFTCKGLDMLAVMGLTEDTSLEDANSLLLPDTGTWLLDGSVKNAVRLYHPLDPDTGEVILEACTLEVKIKRNWVIYFIKQICTMLLVTAGGLLALLMKPGELLGDRCAQLLVAVLIIITSLQTDLGLGNLSYLIWVDLFNLMQLVVLLIALAQTMIIHRLEHYQLNDIVIIFDKVFRVLIPLVLYPCSVVGMICLGMEFKNAGWAFILIGFLGSLIFGSIWVYDGYIKAKAHRRKACEVALLLNADTPEKEYTDCLTSLFKTFDLDGGGDIDIQEFRTMLKTMYRDAPRSAIARAMVEVHAMCGADEELELDTFMDAFEMAKKTMEEERETRSKDTPRLVKLKREVVQAKPTVEATVESTKPKGVLKVSATKAEEKINRF